jgi:hypothetical protein
MCISRDQDKAFDSLEKAYQEHSSWLVTLLVDPLVSLRRSVSPEYCSTRRTILISSLEAGPLNGLQDSPPYEPLQGMPSALPRMSCTLTRMILLDLS